MTSPPRPALTPPSPEEHLHHDLVQQHADGDADGEFEGAGLVEFRFHGGVSCALGVVRGSMMRAVQKSALQGIVMVVCEGLDPSPVSVITWLVVFICMDLT